MRIRRQHIAIVLLVGCVCLFAVSLAASRRRTSQMMSVRTRDDVDKRDHAATGEKVLLTVNNPIAPDTNITIDPRVIAGGGGTSSGTASGGVTIKVEGTIGQTVAGTTSASSNGQFSVTSGFWPAEASLASTPSPTPTPTPVIPSPPIILAEGSNSNQAVALDSVTFARSPFPVLTDHNFSADHHTRVILFTSYLGLTQPDSSALTVQASGFALTVENVGTVTGVNGLEASYIVVRLPDGLPTGDLPLTVTLHAAMSNVIILSISP